MSNIFSQPYRLTQIVVLVIGMLLLTPQPCEGQTGACNDCKRLPGNPASKECLTTSVDNSITCSEGDAKNVRCYSYRVFHRGVKDNPKDEMEKLYKERFEVQGCIKAKKDVEKCAKDKLQLTVPDGECTKGYYSLKHFNEFTSCTSDAEINVSQISGKDGQFYGEKGNEQYVDVVLCNCKGDKCNKDHNEATLNKAPETSAGARLKCFKFPDVITTSMLIFSLASRILVL